LKAARNSSTWLTRIVINAALMRRRSAKARPSRFAGRDAARGRIAGHGTLRSQRSNPEQVFAGTELREIISENLDELSPLLRTAFVLREMEGYSTGEAAKKTGRDGKHAEGSAMARTGTNLRSGSDAACAVSATTSPAETAMAAE